MPIGPSIFYMFSNESVRLLQTHMVQANACAETLLPFFDAALKEEWDVAEVHQKKIVMLENDCDSIKKKIRTHLPRGLFSPVPRPDVLLLVSAQDAIANKAQDIAGVVYGRKMKFPKLIKSSTLRFLQRSLCASDQANKAIVELDELLISGFSGAEVDLLKGIIEELNRIEHDTDDLQIEIRSLLYTLEEEVPPIDMMFLYKIIEWIGELADQAQKVGGQLLLLLAR